MTPPSPFPGAAELARRIRAGVVDARALLEQHLDRIGRRNPGLNAIVLLRAEAARARADAADADAWRGNWWGLLHGVPITIKECFDWVYRPSACGGRCVSGVAPTRCARWAPARGRCRSRRTWCGRSRGREAWRTG
jgi:Asp-tRNA(Asn)/Glu-tRNA(Gln) amidotransferase A subunit family amidase